MNAFWNNAEKNIVRFQMPQGLGQKSEKSQHIFSTKQNKKLKDHPFCEIHMSKTVSFVVVKHCRFIFALQSSEFSELRKKNGFYSAPMSQ